MLASHVKSLVGVDTAVGMIDAFNTKLENSDTPNLCAINHLLTSANSPVLQDATAALATKRGEPSLPPYQFDLIVSHLTLHHIPSLPEIFATLHACLNPGGVVALTDYEDYGPEAVAFHPKSKRPGVERHGVKKREVEELLLAAGFKEVKAEQAFVLMKEVEAEDEKPVREMAFPFLLCFGVKN